MSLLNQPVTTKFRKEGGNARLEYGVAAMQGYREQMEDAHATHVGFDARSATSFFAVYDGHGGPAVAKYCAKHLHTKLRSNQAYRAGNLVTAVEETFLSMDVMLRDRSAGKELSKCDVKGGPWKKYAMKNTLKNYFKCLQGPIYEGPFDEGCTACVALITDNHIIVGNAGDSRCVISRDGQAIDLSTDHKAFVEAERQRIEAAGRAVNHVRGAFRIDGGIAVSRAIGDLRYKDNPHLAPQDQGMTALPEVRTENITAGTEFLVIACDGIWDCMTSQQVVDFIRIYLDHAKPVAICASLLDHCISQPRGMDNMSVILVKFKNAQPAINPRVQLPPQQLPPQQPPPQQPSIPELPVVHTSPEGQKKVRSAPSSFIGNEGATGSGVSCDDPEHPKSAEL